jgi:hypothetical protein
MDANFIETGKNSFMSFLSSQSQQSSSSSNNDKTSSTIKSTSSTPITSGNEVDIPKEELMALCMKLNKKMQSLESKCHDLNRIKTKLNDDRSFLVEIISNILENNISSNMDEAIERPSIQNAVESWKSIQHENISLLEKKVTDLESKRNNNNNNNSNSKHEVNTFEINSSIDTQLEEVIQENEVHLQ